MKLCPLAAQGSFRCRQDFCEWYDSDSLECSITIIARNLTFFKLKIDSDNESQGKFVLSDFPEPRQ